MSKKAREGKQRQWLILLPEHHRIAYFTCQGNNIQPHAISIKYA